MNNVSNFLGDNQGLLCQAILPLIADQAQSADKTRSIDPSVIKAIKSTDLIRASATGNIGGAEASVLQIAQELEAIAGACASTGWCLWNHLCVFHFICGQMGPDATTLLREIVTNREWVSFPAGAGTSVHGKIEKDNLVLNGRASFASGAKYGDWAACLFALDSDAAPTDGKPDLRFTVVRTDTPGVSVDPTWHSMSLRASATDHIDYKNTLLPASRIRQFLFDFRVQFRDAKHGMVAHRYREDWVALSDLWLGAQAVGLTAAALDQACHELQDRVAIFGVRVAERPAVQLNIGHAAAAISSARAAVHAGCSETDTRIAETIIPNETDYLRQQAYSMTALRLCDEAMRHILRVQGGNGLREEGSFERRYRDFQAMPLHINAHPDRVTELVGKHLLGQENNAPFR